MIDETASVAGDMPRESSERIPKNEEKTGNDSMETGENKIIKSERNDIERNNSFGSKNDKSDIVKTEVIQATKLSLDMDGDLTEKIEEDDIPCDFFDDFLKEEFMAGLDVVDEDDSEKIQLSDTETTVEIKQEPPSETIKSEKLTQEDLRHKLKKKHEEDESQRPVEEETQKHVEEETRKHKVETQHKINSDSFDIRRDPSKTKRDIERDKIKCKRDKERKIISEKLRIVETGLVPPGTEMEIDLSQVKVVSKDEFEFKMNTDLIPNNQESNQNKLKNDSVKKKRSIRLSREKHSGKKDNIQKDRKPKKLSPGKVLPSLTRQRSREDDPVLRSDRSSKKTGGQSPRHLRGRSPGKLIKRSREQSPRRSRSPRRFRAGSPRGPLERKSLERSLRRSVERNIIKSRDPSPRRFLNRISQERGLRRSVERELRLSMERDLRRSVGRNLRRSRENILLRERRSRERFNERAKRSRDRSLRHSLERNRRSRDNSIERYKRISLNRRRSRSPLSSTQSFLKEIVEKLNTPRQEPDHWNTQYNHPASHSMGPTEIYHVPHLNPVSVPAPQPPQVQYQAFDYDQSFFIGTPEPVVNSNSSMNHYPVQQYDNYPAISAGRSHMEDDYQRLFQDKKRTLPEFPSFTEKPDVRTTTPDHLRNRSKVLSRCQEAINYLNRSEKKFSGALIIQDDVKKPSDDSKFQSPLLRSSDFKIPFTELPSASQQCNDFKVAMDGVLRSAGLKEQIDKEKTPKQPDPQLIDSKLSKPVNLGALTFSSLNKMIQTDERGCPECENRKKIVYKQIGVQCTPTSQDKEVQVSDRIIDDELMRTRSLAALTPAQLLARSANSSSASYTAYPSGRVGYPVGPPKQYPPNRDGRFGYY